MNFAKQLCDETFESTSQVITLDDPLSSAKGDFDIEIVFLLRFLNERLDRLSVSEMVQLFTDSSIMLSRECDSLCNDMKAHDYIIISHRYLLYSRMVEVSNEWYAQLCENVKGLNSQ
jgi:hypothetical protein